MRKLHLIGLVVPLCFFAGCNNVAEVDGEIPGCLSIESVGGIKDYVVSKSVITGNTIPAGGKMIGVFVKNAENGLYDGHPTAYTNVRYDFEIEGWCTATPIYLSDTPGKLYAYYPYRDEASDAFAVPVTSSLDGTDWLYATPVDVSNTNKKVNLTMNHALSRLNVTLRKGNYTGACVVSDIALTGTVVDASGTLDLTTGTVTPDKADANAAGTFETALAKGSSFKTKNMVLDFLLVPGSSQKGILEMAFKIDDKTTTVAVSDILLASGVQNNIELVVNDNGVRIADVTVGLWGDEGKRDLELDSGDVVTVKVSDDARNDVLLNVRLNDAGDAVIIDAFSRYGKALKCTYDDGTAITPSVNAGMYTFEVAGVTDNVSVTVAYNVFLISALYADGSETDKASLTINGVACSPSDVSAGEPVTFGVTDLVDGYILEGWYDSASGGNRLAPQFQDSWSVERADSAFTVYAMIRQIRDNALSVSCYPDDETGSVSTHEANYRTTESVTLTAAPAEHYQFLHWVDENENVIGESEELTIKFLFEDVNVTAVFIPEDAIKASFTVGKDENGKPVRVVFSKGNLYCAGLTFDDDFPCYPTNMESAQWGFEEYQYGTTPKEHSVPAVERIGVGGSTGSFEPGSPQDTSPVDSTKRVDSHVSHFFYLSQSKYAVAVYPLNLKSTPSPKSYTIPDDYDNSTLFCAEGFTVNGFDKWMVLSKDQMSYLMNTDVTREGRGKDLGLDNEHKYNFWNAVQFLNPYGVKRYYPCGAEIDGNFYPGIFIYPDNYGVEMEKECTETDHDVLPHTWDEINAAGIVYLPMSGCRENVTDEPFSKDNEYWITNYCCYWFVDAKYREFRYNSTWGYYESNTDFFGGGSIGGNALHACAIRLVARTK